MQPHTTPGIGGVPSGRAGRLLPVHTHGRAWWRWVILIQFRCRLFGVRYPHRVAVDPQRCCTCYCVVHHPLVVDLTGDYVPVLPLTATPPMGVTYLPDGWTLFPCCCYLPIASSTVVPRLVWFVSPPPPPPTPHRLVRRGAPTLHPHHPGCGFRRCTPPDCSDLLLVVVTTPITRRCGCYTLNSRWYWVLSAWLRYPLPNVPRLPGSLLLDWLNIEHLACPPTHALL